MQLERPGLRPVPPDHDERGDASLCHLRNRILLAHAGLELEASRGAKNGSPLAQNAPDLSQPQAAMVSSYQASETVEDAEDLPAEVVSRPGDCPDRCVHPRGVSSARQHGDAFHRSARLTVISAVRSMLPPFLVESDDEICAPNKGGTQRSEEDVDGLNSLHRGQPGWGAPREAGHVRAVFPAPTRA